MKRELLTVLLFPLLACSGNAAPDDVVGTWTGYAENHSFPSGKDTITVVITDEALSGHVVFGDAAPLAAPDPNVGYPPGLGSDPFAATDLPRPAEGFEYSLHDGSVDGTRVQFAVAPNEVWEEWCALQTPIADEVNAGRYACLPNWGTIAGDAGCWQTDPSTNTDVPVDCGKLALCGPGGVCECSSTECTVDANPYATFDLQLDANELDGTAAELHGLDHVHFERE